jgi:hypothetical protein
LKSQTVSKTNAQRLALAAGGRVGIRLGSRKNPKPEKCLKTAQSPTSPLHALLGSLLAYRTFAEKRRHRQHVKILQRTLLLTNDQKMLTYKNAGDLETKTQTNQNKNFGKPDFA